jgi:hypothetical protein
VNVFGKLTKSIKEIIDFLNHNVTSCATYNIKIPFKNIYNIKIIKIIKKNQIICLFKVGVVRLPV